MMCPRPRGRAAPSWCSGASRRAGDGRYRAGRDRFVARCGLADAADPGPAGPRRGRCAGERGLPGIGPAGRNRGVFPDLARSASRPGHLVIALRWRFHRGRARGDRPALPSSRHCRMRWIRTSAPIAGVLARADGAISIESERFLLRRTGWRPKSRPLPRRRHVWQAPLKPRARGQVGAVDAAERLADLVMTVTPICRKDFWHETAGENRTDPFRSALAVSA